MNALNQRMNIIITERDIKTTQSTLCDKKKIHPLCSAANILHALVVTGSMEDRFREGLQPTSVLLVFPDQQRLDSGTRAVRHVDI